MAGLMDAVGGGGSKGGGANSSGLLGSVSSSGGSAGPAPGPASTGQQISNLVKNIPAGFGHFIASAPIDVASILATVPEVAKVAATGKNLSWFTPDAGESYSDLMARRFPDTYGFVQSVGQSEQDAGQVAQVAAQQKNWNDTALAQASREGTIVPRVFNDVANATAVLSAGAKLAGAPAELAAQTADASSRAATLAETGEAANQGRLFLNPEEYSAATQASRTAADEAAQTAAQRAAQFGPLSSGLTRASELGGTVANAPAAIYTEPIRLLSKALTTPFGEADASILGRIADQPAVQAAIDKATPIVQDRIVQPIRNRLEAADAQTLMHEEGTVPFHAAAGEHMDLVRQGIKAAGSDDAGTAANLIRSGVAEDAVRNIDEAAPRLAEATGQAEDAIRQQLAEKTLGPSVTPEAWRIAQDYVHGNLDATTKGNIERAIPFLDKATEAATQRYTEGFGSRTGLTPEGLAQRAENVGSEVLSAPIQAVQDKWAPQIARATKQLAGAQEVADRAAGRRVLSPDEYQQSAQQLASHGYAQAQEGAARIFAQDPELARAAAGIDPRWKNISPQRIQDTLAGKLVSSSSSAANPAFREAADRLTQQGFSLPHSLPNPTRALRGVEEGTVAAVTRENAYSQAYRQLFGRDPGPVRPTAPWQARTDTLSKVLGEISGNQRDIGAREAIAKLRERDVAKAETQLNRVLSGRANAERVVREGAAGVPARFAEVARARGNIRNAMADLATTVEEKAKAEGVDIAGTGANIIRNELIPEVSMGLDTMIDRGLNPRFLHGGFEEEGTTAATRADRGVPRSVKTMSERYKNRTAGTTDFTIKGQLMKDVGDMKQQFGNEAAKMLADRFGIKGPEGMTGSAARKYMEQQGYKPFDPASPFSGNVADRNINEGTTYMRKEVLDSFNSGFGQNSGFQRGLQKWYDRRFMGTFKTGSLALSPRWLMGHLQGNAMMAMIGGGVSPASYIRHIPDAMAMLADQNHPLWHDGNAVQRWIADWNDSQAARAETASAKYGDLPIRELKRNWLTGDRELLAQSQIEDAANKGILPSPVNNPVKKIAGVSYGFMQKIDSLNRTIVYLDKIERGLGKEEAIKQAVYALGDFEKMTPFERDIVKRLIPYYPFYRHITKLALTLPIYHPTRTIWVMHFADMFNPSQNQQNLPVNLQGAVPVQGTALQPLLGKNAYLPFFADLPFGRAQGSPLLSPANAMKNITPAIKWPAAVFYGANTSKGLQPLARPPGTPANQPLWKDPQALAYYMGQQFPQTRTAETAAMGNVQRYSTGEEMKTGGQTIPVPESRTQQVANQIFGLPAPINWTPDQQTSYDATQQKKAKTLSTAAHSYATGGARRGRPAKSGLGTGLLGKPKSGRSGRHLARR